MDNFWNFSAIIKLDVADEADGVDCRGSLNPTMEVFSILNRESGKLWRCSCAFIMSSWDYVICTSGHNLPVWLCVCALRTTQRYACTWT